MCFVLGIVMAVPLSIAYVTLTKASEGWHKASGLGEVKRSVTQPENSLSGWALD